MFSFLKKIPFIGWIFIVLIILFAWQYLSGWSYSNKLWNMVKNEIVADQKRIIEELERDNLANQKEKESLYRQIDKLKTQRAELARERDALTATIEELRHALENVIVPDNPDDLINLLRKLGLKSIHRRKR
jgi:flagellar biosynthesis/type III secretory pathway M-ring protein FliF/YscJ